MRVSIECPENVAVPEDLVNACGSRLVAEILFRRDISTPEEARAFLEPDCYTPTPFGDLPGIDRAVDILLAALDGGQKICVYGDYDVDGVTSTCLLVELIESLGGSVTYHVPDRFREGYGMHERVVRNLAQNGVSMLLTCDCGISNHREISLAKELGMKVVVTDHHMLPAELPPADAVVNPKLLPETHPAVDIPGVGVAYFLAGRLLERLGRKGEEEKYLDLVALGVVADVVPLLKENRYLLQRGINVLKKTGRPGLRALMEVSGVADGDLTEEEVAFQLAPRINSAGRISSAETAVKLILTGDSGEAEKLARKLDLINKERREITDKIYNEVVDIFKDSIEQKPVVLYQPHWHQGVIGIAAGRLCEHFHVPAVLMCLKDDGVTVAGSARSVSSINIYEKINKCSQFLDKFGGHAGAAGFSLSKANLTAFSMTLEKVLCEELAAAGTVRRIKADLTLSLKKVNTGVYREIRKLAPFGEQNPAPTFYCSEARVVHQRPTADEKHLRLILRENGVSVPAVWWWGGEKKFNGEVELVYSIGVNRWQGEENVQLVVDYISEKAADETRTINRKEQIAELEIIDRRGWEERGDTFPEYEHAVYFKEGPGVKHDKRIINRYQLREAETLVLLSIPPGIRVLRELIAANSPRRLVLAYSPKDIKSSAGFLNQLLGIVKYAVKEKGGKVSLYQLSVLTGEMESTVVVALRYFQDIGLVELEFISRDEVLIKKGQVKEKSKRKTESYRLKSLIAESQAFRRYMVSSSINKIKYLLKNNY